MTLSLSMVMVAWQASYTEREARDVFLILMKTIKYLHDNDIVHRDLKVHDSCGCPSLRICQP